MSNLSATKLGKLMEPGRKAAAVNKLLVDSGYMERDKSTGLWQLTSLGQKYGIVTSKTMGIIVWKKSMVQRLQSVDAD